LSKLLTWSSFRYLPPITKGEYSSCMKWLDWCYRALDSKEFETRYDQIGRSLNLLIIVNVTVFVTSGLIQGFQYYFPLIALGIFMVLQFVLTVPLFKLRNTITLLIITLTMWVGVYFTVASIIYMVQHGDFIKLGAS